MQKGDGTDSYINSLYFGPIEQVYKFTGRIEATNIIDGTIDIGNDSFMIDNQSNITIKRGSINMNDKFIVDSNGNMTATNGTFSGNINGSNITGSNITANSTINVESVGLMFN